MAHLIDKDALVAEINELDSLNCFESITISHNEDYKCGYSDALEAVRNFIDTLEVKDFYEQCVQYDSIKAGIQAHAETYSFNIESELFNQLTKEQQALWRKEIEQAVISGGDAGIELARDTRYKENLKAKEVVTEQEGICNGILNRIIGDTWNLVIPLDKVGLKHGDKVKISIIKEQCKAQKGE